MLQNLSKQSPEPPEERVKELCKLFSHCSAFSNIFKRMIHDTLLIHLIPAPMSLCMNNEDTFIFTQTSVSSYALTHFLKG